MKKIYVMLAIVGCSIGLHKQIFGMEVPVAKLKPIQRYVINPSATNRRVLPLPEFYKEKDIKSGNKRFDTSEGLSNQELDLNTPSSSAEISKLESQPARQPDLQNNAILQQPASQNIKPFILARQKTTDLTKISPTIRKLINETKKGDLRVQDAKLLELALTTDNLQVLSELHNLYSNNKLQNLPENINNVALARINLSSINYNQVGNKINTLRKSSLEIIENILNKNAISIAPDIAQLDNSSENRSNKLIMQNLLQEIRNKKKEVQILLNTTLINNLSTIDNIMTSKIMTLDEKIKNLESSYTNYQTKETDDLRYNKSDRVITAYTDAIKNLKLQKQTVNIVKLLTDDITTLKHKSGKIFREYVQQAQQMNFQQAATSFNQYCSLTLAILVKRGSLTKESIKSTINSLFSSAPHKVTPATQAAVIEQATAVMPAENASAQTFAQWISSITNMISDAMFGKKKDSVEPSIREQLYQGLLPTENRL